MSEEEERSDRILSLLLPPTALEAVRNAGADSLCYGEKFQVSRRHRENELAFFCHTLV